MNIKYGPTGILLTLGLISFTPAIVSASDINFAGTWKGQVKIEVTEGRGGRGPMTGANSATGTTPTISIIPDVANGTARGSTTHNIDLTRQQGGRGDQTNASPPKTHTKTLKLTLSIKIDRNGNFSGYFMTGTNRQIAQEWNVDGNKLTFTTIGPNGIPQFTYSAVLNDKELQIRQRPANEEGDVHEFKMKR